MRPLTSLLGGLLALSLAGCASYRVGPTNGLAAGEKSVQVNFFRNNTLEPRLVEAVNAALRKNIQKDGTFRLNIITVRDYTLSLTAKIIATERNGGKVILQREVSGRTTIRAGTDLASAERQAVQTPGEKEDSDDEGKSGKGSWIT